MKRFELNDKVKKDILSELMKRSPSQYGEYEAVVDDIIADVRDNGDEALFRYTERFDKVKIDEKSILVTEEEFEEAYRSVDKELVEVIRRAKDNIERFHKKQVRNTFVDMEREGILLGQRIIPMERAGVYVPGGKAAYPSSVLMNVIPAKTAGVKEIVMSTPPAKDGKVYAQTLVAAREAGVDKVFKVGGAQAVAALAFGTKSVPRVDKIVGPGNIFVALAKRKVYGHVSIDSIAGPSEILVVADETANPAFVAADLISQAEHDELACATLITTSAKLADEVEKEIEGFLKTLSRREIIEKALDSYGFILIAKDIREACDAANEIAPEHLEIMTADPYETMGLIRNAGAVFLGSYSSEPLGDYYAGPNHILPTNGTARFFSALSVDDFVKKTSIISYSREALRAVHKDIELFAKAEGLTAHANSVAVRFKDEE